MVAVDKYNIGAAIGKGEAFAEDNAFAALERCECKHVERVADVFGDESFGEMWVDGDEVGFEVLSEDPVA